MAREKGCFIIDGVQPGDRTLEQQMRGVEKAIAECEGKTVLDLGSAECLIAREFARAGAKHVHCVERLPGHLEIARKVCAGLSNMSFQEGDLSKIAPQHMTFDIVLALGVAHKLRFPRVGILYAINACHGLGLVRLSKHADAAQGILHAKYYKENTVNVKQEFEAAGYTLESVEDGPFEETVHYYRKRA